MRFMELYTTKRSTVRCSSLPEYLQVKGFDGRLGLRKFTGLEPFFDA